MRIGTWNLDGKWSPEHLALLGRAGCDVWLLTEVAHDVSIPGMQIHRTADPMDTNKAWAAIAATRDVAPRPDPHRASAIADVHGSRFVSSVLPWRGCGPSWAGSTLAEKLDVALNELHLHLDGATVWGGDWNQAFEGSEYVGTLHGRARLIELTRTAHLSVPTRSLGSASPGHRSIDHIAVPTGWDITGAHRVSADVDGHRLSDHDAYVVSVDH